MKEHRERLKRFAIDAAANKLSALFSLDQPRVAEFFEVKTHRGGDLLLPHDMTTDFADRWPIDRSHVSPFAHHRAAIRAEELKDAQASWITQSLEHPGDFLLVHLTILLYISIFIELLFIQAKLGSLLSMLVSILIATACPILAQPSLELGSMMALTYRTNAEPSVFLNQFQIANAPTGDFSVKVRVLDGDTVLGETIPGQIYRAESMAAVQLRPKTITLGNTAGVRTIQLMINDQPVDKFDFRLEGAAGSWQISGPWQDHAQIRIPLDPKPTDRLRFDWWSSALEFTDTKTPYQAVLKLGGKVLGAGAQKFSFGQMWVKATDNFRMPSNQFITAADVPKMGSGDFTIDIVQGSKTIKTYRGTLSGGTFVAHPRSGAETKGVFLPDREVSSAMNKLHPDRIIWLAPK